MKRAAAVALVILLTGCQTVSDTYNQWFGTPRIVQKPAELTTIQPTATLRILWRGGVGRAEKSVFFPAVSSNVVYATGTNGQIGAFDAVSGTPAGQVDTGQRLSGGVGAGAGLVVVGTGLIGLIWGINSAILGGCVWSPGQFSSEMHGGSFSKQAPVWTWQTRGTLQSRSR